MSSTHGPLSPLLPDAIMQVSESEQNVSVSCLKYLPLTFSDNLRIQDSGLSHFGNPQNILITGGTFTVVSLYCGLYKQIIIVLFLSARTIFSLPILGKGIWRSLCFKNQTPAHCLLDGKMYSTSFGRFLFIVLIVNWHWGIPVSFGEQEGLERLRSVSNLLKKSLTNCHMCSG